MNLTKDIREFTEKSHGIKVLTNDDYMVNTQIKISFDRLVPPQNHKGPHTH